MSPWLVTYTFRDGSTVRRTLDAPTIDDAYEASTLPKTIGDRVLDGITIENERSDPTATARRYGSAKRSEVRNPRRNRGWRSPASACGKSRGIRRKRPVHVDGSLKISFETNR
ncbi:hypothetical protein [Haladaptatus sp. W1]|uniref:hypothetical protein n=1 Tax=Haladaptatus sp. W1 TaxID=1897478 RepID=UPI0020C7CEB4|nr:hypothetical protein [Haladaptatus sp. W1]